MATAADKKMALERWREHCKQVQNATALRATNETAVEKDKRITRLLNDYPAFCAYYFPHFQTLRNKTTGEVERIVSNAPFHNEAAKKVRNSPNLKAVFKWARGHAKSTHFDIFIPLWLMFQRPHRLINVMVVVGKSEEAAQELLGGLQAELEYNARIIADFGEQKNAGDWQDGRFVTRGGVACFARGRGQSPRGLRHGEARPDYIVIDDLDDDELCRNPKRVAQLTEWVKEALFGALDVGRGRFIMVGNLISKTSVLANIAATKGVHVSQVNAVDANGEPVWRDKWTKEEAQEAAEFMGYRSWQKEMMHNPIADGTIFKGEWIRYKKMLPLRDYAELVCYTDPSYKSTTANDYKASRFWGKTKSGELHLIDCYVRQDTTGGMVRWLYNLYEDLPADVAVRFYIEANFLQDVLLDEFDREAQARGYHLPILPDKRKKPDKLQRIEAISPLWERGKVFYNEKLKDSSDMQVGIEQTLALERGSRVHDDAPDADEGAIYILQRSGRIQSFTPRFGKRPTSKNIW